MSKPFLIKRITDLTSISENALPVKLENLLNDQADLDYYPIKITELKNSNQLLYGYLVIFQLIPIRNESIPLTGL